MTTLRAAGDEPTAAVSAGGFGAPKQSVNVQTAAPMPSAGFGQQAQPNYQQQQQAPHTSFNNTSQTSSWGNQNYNQQAPSQPHFGQQNYGNGYAQNRSRGNYQTVSQNVSKKLAIFSLITGIYSFPMINLTVGAFFMGVFMAIFGTAGAFIGLAIIIAVMPTSLITGIVAARRAKKYPQQYGGRGMAIAGICLSAFSLIAIPVVAAIAIPNLLAARRSANEGSAIASVKKIAKAMPVMNGQCGSLQSLSLDDPPLKSGEKSGYRFSTAVSPTGACEIHAVPLVIEGVSKSGNRSFYAASDDQWTIRAADKNGKQATKNDPEIKAGF